MQPNSPNERGGLTSEAILDLEQIDLALLTAELERRVSGPSLAGWVRGRTKVRDAVVEKLACSELEAEQLVDMLIGRRFLRFSGDPASAQGGGLWTIDPNIR
jgi:hypothetical protein